MVSISSFLRSALGPLDWICIGLFWACILAQLIAGFVIIGSRNYAFPYVESEGVSTPYFVTSL